MRGARSLRGLLRHRHVIEEWCRRRHENIRDGVAAAPVAAWPMHSMVAACMLTALHACRVCGSQRSQCSGGERVGAAEEKVDPAHQLDLRAVHADG